MTALNARAGRAQTGASQTDLDRPDNDYFVTSPEATRALLRVEDFPGVIWEPACGDGTMARELAKGHGVNFVLPSDVVDYGYPNAKLHNFLTVSISKLHPFDHIVTNPPYSLAEAFVQKALSLRPRKVAMILRTVWLEGAGRYQRLWSTNPPARVWVFTKRPTFQRDGVGEFRSGLISFSWVVWDRSHVGPPQLGWLP